MDDYSFLFIAIPIFLVIGIGVYAHIAAKRRREALAAFAQHGGFVFHPDGYSPSRDTVSFKVFNFGHSNSIYNSMVRKANEVELVITDYSYVTGGGKNRTTHYQTLCLVTSSAINVPHFFVRREARFFDFLGKIFGGQDINFDEDPDFSSAFVLQGQSEADTREFFTEPIRRKFLEYKNTNYQFEGKGNTVMLNCGTTVDPNKLGGVINITMTLVEALSGGSDTGSF
jgi:hypothetical protein